MQISHEPYYFSTTSSTLWLLLSTSYTLSIWHIKQISEYGECTCKVSNDILGSRTVSSSGPNACGRHSVRCLSSYTQPRLSEPLEPPTSASTCRGVHPIQRYFRRRWR